MTLDQAVEIVKEAFPGVYCAVKVEATISSSTNAQNTRILIYTSEPPHWTGEHKSFTAAIIDAVNFNTDNEDKEAGETHD
jgi:hypothetical protein